MELGLKGRTALVTGASIGIGRGIATALAREGVRLAVVARRRNLLEELERELNTKLVIIEQDFLAAGAPEAIAEQALAGLGSVDILVNNAGGSRRFTLESSEAQWEEALTLNFTRQRQLTHRLLPQMIARKWGRIVNITGKSEPEGLNGAFAAKAAMHSWAKGLSREVGKHGITVNSIPPGRVDSEQIRRNYTPEYRQWQADGHLFLVRADASRTLRWQDEELSLTQLNDRLHGGGQFQRCREVTYRGQKAVQHVAEATVILDRPAWRHRSRGRVRRAHRAGRPSGHRPAVPAGADLEVLRRLSARHAR